MIDKRYWGIVQLREGKWVVLLQNPSELSAEDMDAIRERIEEYELTVLEKNPN